MGFWKHSTEPEITFCKLPYFFLDYFAFPIINCAISLISSGFAKIRHKFDKIFPRKLCRPSRGRLSVVSVTFTTEGFFVLVLSFNSWVLYGRQNYLAFAKWVQRFAPVRNRWEPIRNRQRVPSVGLEYTCYIFYLIISDLPSKSD